MFTDIVDSTAMTARLGDLRSVEMVRAHDALVRRALKDKGGREVKHTGDGIMASFDKVTEAVACARAIQQAFDAFNLASREKLRVRIGLDAGEPVADSNDLFGTTVQMAARLCQSADPDAIVASEAVLGLVADQSKFIDLGCRSLKGFAHPVKAYEVTWR
jgi:class 3 adenylate cyclase